MDLPSLEEHGVPSQSSCLIPEYVNLAISVLRRSKIIQEKYKKGGSISKVFGLIELSASVAMSVTKSIIPETASFSSNLIHN